MKSNTFKKNSALILLVAGFVTLYGVNTTQDKAATQTLFQEAKSLKGITQSHTHLNSTYVQDKVKELSGLDRHKDLINRALTKEVEMAKQGYMVFYTAVPYMRMFQDITRKMYKVAVGKVGALQEKAFQFIRYTYNDPAYTQYNSATHFLLKEIQKEGIIDDNLARLKTILVSTNLSFFGNAGLTGESTYHYFNNPQPWASLNPVWLEASLKSYGYSIDFVKDLMEVAADIVTDTGDLFQIFIPKNMVNRAGYLSWRQGIPFDVKFIEYLFERENMKFSRRDRIYAAEINKRIAEFKEKYKNNDPITRSWVWYLLTQTRQGKYYLEPFLNEYKKGKLPFMNFYQARLVLGPWMFDPTKGIKIYRYSTLDKAREEKYKIALKKIFENMEQERKERLGLVRETEQEPTLEKEIVTTKAISKKEQQEMIKKIITEARRRQRLMRQRVRPKLY